MKFKQFIYILLFAFAISCSNKQSNFNLQEGDLVFQDLDCGELCEAIETVTKGIDNTNLSHVGIVIIENNKIQILEAIGKNVHTTKVNNFLNRVKDNNGEPKVIVGRVKAKYQNLITPALMYAKTLINKPYDNIFDINDDNYYCSELIYFAFKYANNKNDFFKLSPMTFIDPTTGKTFPAWEKYYDSLNTKIPEGEPGLNPGSISRSNKIKIVHKYYK
ncbi:MAG: YiiX/YebB-like N1pC/P60 family cysteine hydrolase [Bacteroidota bacterium]|nr:YiiX/YebB-like N1pC/P60 family cysteine hydrolase [Bacteroidota bacterium]